MRFSTKDGSNRFLSNSVTLRIHRSENPPAGRYIAPESHAFDVEFMILAIVQYEVRLNKEWHDNLLWLQENLSVSFLSMMM
jgi:hypothetical protein